jgi:hypothetical protein
MSKLLLALLLVMNMDAIAQIQPVKEKPVPVASLADYEVTKDIENGERVYMGVFTFKDLERDTAFSWLPQGMNSYEPNAKAMKYLREHLHDYSLKVFLGTWCDDSHQQIPKLFKVLQLLGNVPTDILLTGMDRGKITKDQYMADVRQMKITLLPTIVVLDKDGNEAGRITESVQKSMEDDLVKIIKRDRRK